MWYNSFQRINDPTRRSVMKSKNKKARLRRRGFGILKAIMRWFVKPTEFVYLGGELPDGTVIVSNHVGTSAPLALELYSGLPFRFWGAWQMNAGLIQLYKYQTRVFYHEKKHWNIHLARLFCLIASPLTCMFYSGLNLISTYTDVRFCTTIRESMKALEAGHSIAIFPEDSTKGYLDELEGFHGGFLMMGEICLRRGVDFPVCVAYYKKNERKYVFDKPIMVSELLAGGRDREEVAKELCERCNHLGRTDVETLLSEMNASKEARITAKRKLQ